MRINKNARSRLLGGSTALALILAFGIEAAAQQVAIEEITVTTRKRAESLQDVPLSITAVNDDLLRDANIFSLEDLAAATPGFTFTNIRALGTPTIRGLAQTDGGAIQTNVGVFMDGIYINNRSGLEFGNMDLQRIEVAKGPQSSLFGRDSFSGAINYVTRDPVIGEFDGLVQLEGGTDERAGIKGSINIPVSDTVAIRAFGGYSTFDGTIKNVRGGENLGGWDKRLSVGGSILLEPSDQFSLKLFGLRNEVEEDQPPLIAPDFRNNNAGAQYVNANGTFLTLFGGDIPTSDSVGLDSRGRGNTGGITLLYAKADYDFDSATLTGTISHTKSGYDGFFDNVADLDAVNRPLAGPVSSFFLTDTAGDAAEQQTYELLLTSNTDGPLEWLLGGTYYDTSSSLQTASQGALIGQIDNLVQISDFSETLDQEVKAVFAAAAYDVTDKFTIGGEVRYTDEDQTLDVFQNFILFNLILADTEESIGFDYVSGRATVEYRPNEDNLFYFYAGRGVKTGGINPGREGLDFFTFEPETNWTYEIGSKSTLLENRLALNMALYYVDWRSVQATAPGDLSAASVTFNGVGASSKGIEVDATFYPTDNLALTVAGTYLDPQYDDGYVDGAFDRACLPQTADFVSSTCDGNVSGNQIAKTSKTQLYTSVTHTVPEFLNGFDLVNRVDFTHEGRRPTTSIGTAKTPATNLFNYRLSFQRNKTEISFWVDNVFDQEWIAEVLPISSTEANTPQNCGSSCSVRQENIYPGNGRQLGVTLVQRF
jgi:iron complex outermembrane receptor protein